MRTDITLPELGEDAGVEATVSFWYVEKDGPIREGEDLVEMVTDKATFNVPSPATGTLVEQSVSEGDVVAVGGKMGVLERAE